MNSDIFKYLKTPCIAAHRGSCGGNIPPNTISAYEAALFQGATILEADVARSLDGIFYMFHTGNEPFYLGIDKSFEKMTSAELNSIFLRNEFGKETSLHLDLFEDVLEHFQNRCVLNLDRCWQYLQDLIPIIERHGMRDQILLKTPCKKEWIDKILELAPEYAYMPIIVEDITEFYEMGGDKIPGFIGAELVFSTEQSPIIRTNTMELLHRSGRLAWGNGIQFSKMRILSAGHNDDISITGHPNAGWGWLIDNGFDIIQTDWVAALKSYLSELYLPRSM